MKRGGRLVFIVQLLHRYAPEALLLFLLELSAQILGIGSLMLFPGFLAGWISKGRGEGIWIMAVAATALIYFGLAVSRQWRLHARKLANAKLELSLRAHALSLSYVQLESEEIKNNLSGAYYTLHDHALLENLWETSLQTGTVCVLFLLGGFYLLRQNGALLFVLGAGAALQIRTAARLNEKLAPFFGELYPINRKFDWFRLIQRDKAYQKDIRAFQMQEMIAEKMSLYNRKVTAMFREMNTLTFANLLAVSIWNVGTILLSMGFCLMQWNRGRMSLTVLTVSTGLILAWNTSLAGFTESLSLLFQLLGYIEPLRAVFETVPSHVQGDELLTELREIEFQQVSYRYPGAETWAIHDISFLVRRGERIALVGLNGSGKTTLIKLLAGLYSPTKGEILVNGKPLRCYRRKQYLEKIAAVFQDNQLFSDSLENNLCLGNQEAIEVLPDVLEMTELKGLIGNLPKGLKTMIGTQEESSGVALSGGETKRVALARALCRRANLFVFDEPFASLDPLAEAEIYQNIERFTTARMGIFVSHKMATTKFCDRILVLEHGELKEQGTHEELLKRQSGRYAMLYQKQKEAYERKGE